MLHSTLSSTFNSIVIPPSPSLSLLSPLPSFSTSLPFLIPLPFLSFHVNTHFPLREKTRGTSKYECFINFDI
ncbi:hypothetical protein Lalb_Chr06g0172021 [Lupinus albus]|uniref:Uncharacterized protein n=1 Tax=Lupinus albus TaxID=3870 RepID=A0A6A4QDI6_LUPAL|nr:hypothetical protein Lalb_Chr06g0172021 [Lupinus albus]